MGADNGTVVLFDREADDKLYRKGRSVVAVGQPHAIRSIACSPSEESLVCTLDNCSMLSLNLANAETVKVCTTVIACPAPQDLDMSTAWSVQIKSSSCMLSSVITMAIAQSGK